MTQSRNRLSGVAAVLVLTCAVALAALAPAVAHAAIHRVWIHGKRELPKGAPHVVFTSSGTKFALSIGSGPGAGREVTCKKISYRAEVWNPAPVGNGEDSLTAMRFSSCKSESEACTVHALALPWHSVLFRGEALGDEGDVLEEVDLEVGCPSFGVATFAGEAIGHLTIKSHHVFVKGLLGGAGGEAEVSLELHLPGGISIDA